MIVQLRLLHALSSVYDSLAQDYTGEAKGELTRLISNLETEPNFAIEGKEQLVADCHEAIFHIRSRKMTQAAQVLVRHSDELWRLVLNSPDN